MTKLISMLNVAGALSKFARDRRGVSAVEFAMILPLMLTLYLGTVEVSQGISIDRKVTLTTRTVTRADRSAGTSTETPIVPENG